MEFMPLRFINESIEVIFAAPPLFQKKPVCPIGFIWRNVHFDINEVISEWRDYTRHGRMAKNMQPQHTAIAALRGSWGVGTFHFRVRTSHDRYFDLYYDRAPKDADDRKGHWFLFREVKQISTDSPS